MKNLFEVGDIITCNSLNGNIHVPHLHNFTVGKEYKVLGLDHNMYQIANDKTFLWVNNHEYFPGIILGFSLKEKVKEFPKLWAVKILPEVKKWIRDEFNTDLYDDDCETHYFHFPNLKNNNGFLNSYHGANSIINHYTEITLQEFLDNVVNKQNKSKKIFTTRGQFISILNKDGCKTFNDEIKKLLDKHPYHGDDFKFIIDEISLQRIEKECTINQKAILKSIGIEYVEPKPLWSRKVLDHYLNDNQYLTKNDLHIHNTMLLMRNWAAFHNQLDEFVADWTNERQSKYGIVPEFNKYKICQYSYVNSFIFQISVNSKERTEEMLTEFKSDLEKCKF